MQFENDIGDVQPCDGNCCDCSWKYECINFQIGDLE